MGAQIFNRGLDPISLTPAGELYVEAVRQIRRISENLEKQVKELEGEIKGTLHIGIAIQRAMEIVPYLYPRFLEEYPVLLANKQCVIVNKYPPGTPVDIWEAREETFISCKQGHGIRKTQDILFLSRGISPKIAFEIDSVEVAKRTVAASKSVMVCPDTFAALDGGYPYCVYPLKNVDVSRHFYVCYRKGSYLNQYQKGFLRILHEMPKAAFPSEPLS